MDKMVLGFEKERIYLYVPNTRLSKFWNLNQIIIYKDILIDSKRKDIHYKKKVLL